ncbi:hypothetical protein CYFUS_002656 [Cystobacter fuscus]|uniref:Uncharacterized protein n=1 Tax=Cystobacter fuscus TaxID=43 RepID=A0A250IZT7_9BACT|nr:hypothetical protein [Cystobacter fuscus]ATB37235.1 hypothetical protein CYFUS_002656 [Cystobacter fuscus]
MMKTLKMGVLGLTLGLTGALVFSSQEARAVPKAPDSNQCKLIRAACILKSQSCQSVACPSAALCMASAGC